MKTLNKFLQKLDSIAPNPWHVDNVKQARPITQFGFFIGLAIGLILCYFLF